MLYLSLNLQRFICDSFPLQILESKQPRLFFTVPCFHFSPFDWFIVLVVNEFIFSFKYDSFFFLLRCLESEQTRPVFFIFLASQFYFVLLLIYLFTLSVSGFILSFMCDSFFFSTMSCFKVNTTIFHISHIFLLLCIYLWTSIYFLLYLR